MTEEKNNLPENKIASFIIKESSFDLQFRRDVKRKRTNNPVYYSWKAQFIISAIADKHDLIKKIQEILNCGKIHYITGTQLRFSIQKLQDLHDKVVPFFEKYKLTGNKKKDFELWAEGVKIIYQNKGKYLSTWPKEPFKRLIDIQKSSQQYKEKRKQNIKWIPIAQAVLEHLKEA